MMGMGFTKPHESCILTNALILGCREKVLSCEMGYTVQYLEWACAKDDLASIRIFYFLFFIYFRHGSIVCYEMKHLWERDLLEILFCL